jgi:predicted regulator of Ras-like GTPase activity (Roadblock/LC7/MglB family)
VDTEHLCAWAAEMGRLAADTVQVWEGGPLRVALFEASMGSLMLADVGKGYVVVAGDPTLNTGMLRLEVERAADAARRFLSAGLVASDAPEHAATA